jgi:hypothetical protein
MRRRGGPAGSYGEYRKVRIGADLEFELHRNGHFFPAHKLLRGLHTPIGLDGNPDTGELRPCLNTGGRADSLYYFSKDAPNTLDSQGISRLLDRLAGMLDETDEVRSSPGCHKALGGHIHISGVPVDGAFLAALDKFIAIPLNEVSNIQLRKSRGYGQLSVIDRVKSHGGVEYRSPPSWISTPDVAKGVIAIAWVLSKLQKHGRIDQIQTFDDFYELRWTPSVGQEEG